MFSVVLSVEQAKEVNNLHRQQKTTENNKQRTENKTTIARKTNNRARTSGGEYSITDDGRVRPKHVLIEFKK
jgi:hypothetical protein